MSQLHRVALVILLATPSIAAFEDAFVPNVVDKTQAQMEAAFEASPFRCVLLNSAFEGGHEALRPEFRVLWQYPPAFRKTDVKLPVFVVLGAPADPRVAKPIKAGRLDVVGEDVDDAHQKVLKLFRPHTRDVDFHVFERVSGKIRTRNDGWQRLRVVAQYPAPSPLLTLTPTDPIALIAVPYTSGKADLPTPADVERVSQRAVAHATTDRRRRWLA